MMNTDLTINKLHRFHHSKLTTTQKRKEQGGFVQHERRSGAAAVAHKLEMAPFCRMERSAECGIERGGVKE
jgi:hypothetical protein